jgi:hypothetical protein
MKYKLIFEVIVDDLGEDVGLPPQSMLDEWAEYFANGLRQNITVLSSQARAEEAQQQ